LAGRIFAEKLCINRNIASGYTIYQAIQGIAKTFRKLRVRCLQAKPLAKDS